MDPYTLAACNQELNNPNSPYYLGRPTAFQQISNYLGSNGNAINTNYFGPNKNFYLAQPNVDEFKITQNTLKKNSQERWFNFAATAVVAVASIFLLKKIKMPKTITRAFSGLYQTVKKPFVALHEGAKKIFTKKPVNKKFPKKKVK